MLNEFNLINMNGRVYDPVLGRFLSPDKYVQEGDNSQNYNSYSYCLNNPLKYADPSGNLFGIDDAIIFGVVSGAVFGTINAAMKGDKIWAGALVGGITGGLSGWAGQALSIYAKAGNIWAGALAGAGAGSIVGSVSSFATTGLNNLLNKRSFTDNILKAMWQSALTGAVSGAISGGFESYENCKDNGVNPFTGNHEGSRRTHYPLRKNVNYNLQPDKTKDCYSYALEYTSKQLGRPETAESFINAANGADGADVSKVLNSPRYKGGLKNYRLIRLPRDTELEQFTKSFELGRYSSVISLTEHHAVALSQYDTVIRNCWFGGSAHIVMDNIQIFDPLIGIRPFYGNVGAFDIIRAKF